MYIQWNISENSHTVNSPGFRAEAIPGQLEELKAQTQKNCVLITDGPHQNTEEESLTETQMSQGELSHDITSWKIKILTSSKIREIQKGLTDSYRNGGPSHLEDFVIWLRFTEKNVN